MKKILILLLLLIAFAGNVLAATGCDLNDPDRDVKRLFPGSTGFKASYTSIAKAGGKALLTKIEQRLGDKFTGLYETAEVPYTIYQIFKGKETIGYIHGVNQKGQYGGIQVFLALDTKGIILNLYFQKMTNQAAAKFRSDVFTKQFKSLSIKDFSAYNPVAGKLEGRLAQITNPAPKADKDFKAVLRGVKKNLILMQEFGYTK